MQDVPFGVGLLFLNMMFLTFSHVLHLSVVYALKNVPRQVFHDKKYHDGFICPTMEGRSGGS